MIKKYTPTPRDRIGENASKKENHSNAERHHASRTYNFQVYTRTNPPNLNLNLSIYLRNLTPSQRSLLILLQLFKIHRNMLHSNLIPINPQTDNNPRGLITKIRVMAPRLPRMHIGHMQLDKGNAHTQQRIANRHRGMCVRARVDDDTVDTAAGGLDAVDDGAFVVGLEGVEGAAVGGRDGAGVGYDVGEGGVAVDVWFAGAEEVEVWTVDEED